MHEPSRITISVQITDHLTGASDVATSQMDRQNLWVRNNEDWDAIVLQTSREAARKLVQDIHAKSPAKSLAK